MLLISFYSFVNYYFSQVYAKVRIGEEVRLSGNVPALGLGNPEKAIPLVTSPTSFPWWVTKEGI